MRYRLFALGIVFLGCSLFQPAPAQAAGCDGVMVTAGVPGKQTQHCLKPGAGAEKGQSFRDCPQCPEMVVVPAGSFLMGSPNFEIGKPEYSTNRGERHPCRGAKPVPIDCHEEDEGPQHRVSIPKPYAIGKFTVTFDEWDACTAGGGCKPDKPRPEDRGWGRGRQPVIYISWSDVKAYLRWLSKKTGHTYRLPSEAEWEYAARAGTMTPFWWGDWATTKLANFRHDSEKPNPDRTVGGYLKVFTDEPDGVFRDKTLPVDEFKPNPWGLHQVHGNVWEWTEDCYHKDYKDKPVELNKTGGAWKVGDCFFRMLRGGSYDTWRHTIRAASRTNGKFDRGRDEWGFRVVRELP